MVIYAARDLTCRSQARDLLAMAVRETWGLSPLPEIARREGGKPYFPRHEELHFNLSHSGALALCALDSGPVGADVQIIKEWRPGLPERVCSPAELDWLDDEPEEGIEDEEDLGEEGGWDNWILEDVEPEDEGKNGRQENQNTGKEEAGKENRP